MAAVGGCSRTIEAPAPVASADGAQYTGRAAVMFRFSQDAAKKGQQFFYVKIPGDIGPEEREKKYEAPLQVALQLQALGRVTGGGSQLGEGKHIAYCGLDVVVKAKESGLTVIREALRQAGAPKSTVIEQYLPDRVDHPL